MRNQLFLHDVNVSRFPASKSMATGSGKMFHEVKCMWLTTLQRNYLIVHRFKKSQTCYVLDILITI